MKKNDAGDFSILYVEPEDDRTTLFPVIAEQKKPVVLMLADQARVFQRPDEFTVLKHVRRQYDLTIIFVIPHGGQLAQMASKNGFPVYLSMESLVNAVSVGQLSRPRRITIPLDGPKSESRPPLAVQQRSRPSNPPPMQPVQQPLPLPQAEPLVVPRRLSIALIVFTSVLVIVIVGSFLLVPALMKKPEQVNKPNPTTSAPINQTVGKLTFVSSGQVNENNSSGIVDKVVVDLSNLENPAASKSYYAWLLYDKKQAEIKSIALGVLEVKEGKTRLNYNGDAQHTNLLQRVGSFLVTEEDAAVPPISPSPDTGTWKYYGEFANAPINTTDNGKKYGYLDHVRHLMATDPTLDQLELPGGLNNWFHRNTIKVFEWASSTREHWEANKDSDYVRSQTIRILTYLDGTTFLYKDLPQGTPLLVDEKLARVGLLTVNGPNQEPPSYFTHIDHHLRGLLASGNANASMRKQMAEMMNSLNYINLSLSEVRKIAQKIVKMSNEELKQPGTLELLNDMIMYASNAYTGDIDVNTSTPRQGVTWLHRTMPGLATLEIKEVSREMKGTSIEIGPPKAKAGEVQPMWLKDEDRVKIL